MTELTYDVTIVGMRVTVHCRTRPITTSVPPGKSHSEYLDIALEAIKADGREIVQVILIRSSMATEVYQVRTKAAAAVLPPADPQQP